VFVEGISSCDEEWETVGPSWRGGSTAVESVHWVMIAYLTSKN